MKTKKQVLYFLVSAALFIHSEKMFAHSTTENILLSVETDSLTSLEIYNVTGRENWLNILDYKNGIYRLTRDEQSIEWQIK